MSFDVYKEKFVSGMNVEKKNEGRTKKEVCGEVFGEMIGMKRGLVISEMMKRSGLSKAGSSTYYQNFKSGKWSY